MENNPENQQQQQQQHQLQLPQPQQSQINSIPLKNQHMVLYGGLRGAISFQCAQLFPDDLGNKSLIVSLTTCLIITTIFIQGIFTTRVLSCLEIDVNVDAKAEIDTYNYHSNDIDNNDNKNNDNDDDDGIQNNHDKNYYFKYFTLSYWDHATKHIEKDVIYRFVVRDQKPEINSTFEDLEPNHAEESSLGGSCAISEVILIHDDESSELPASTFVDYHHDNENYEILSIGDTNSFISPIT